MSWRLHLIWPGLFKHLYQEYENNEVGDGAATTSYCLTAADGAKQGRGMSPATHRILSATTGRSGGNCRGARDLTPPPRTGRSTASGTPVGANP